MIRLTEHTTGEKYYFYSCNLIFKIETIKIFDGNLDVKGYSLRNTKKLLFKKIPEATFSKNSILKCNALAQDKAEYQFYP